ncbi:MAG: hypothetical protein FWF84_00430, partial [Kiritimatiellaeota bacterium]|nr:hypothetical protein [Kiritimatiellota bacterium]
MQILIRILALCILLQFTTFSLAAENMIGRQSQNEGILAVPAKGPVTIDGDLADWDLSGQIWSFADIAVRENFSVKTAAMWDKDYLYLAYVWKDPIPMLSTVNPDYDPDKGWVSDAIQMRVTAGGQTSWLDTWYHTPTRRAVFQYSYWKDEGSDTKGLEGHLLISKPGETDMGEGIQLAYKLLPSGDGFVQEMRIPWRIIYKKPHTAEANDVFKMGLEFLWGPITGDTWPLHRYADNMAKGETSREFFWTGKRLWGDIRLSDKGNLEPRRYIADTDRLEGCIPVRAELPDVDNFDKIAGFTLVIETADGKRIRNLAGDFDPREYAVKDAPVGTVEVMWDGLDDAGKLVPVGEYRVRGLIHGHLGADFERTYYNPGTPPWATVDGSGGWGADHSAPNYITRCGEWVIVAWGFAEGGSGMIGIDASGQKRWGERRGASALCGNDKYVYIIPNSWHTTEETLMRIVGADGSFMPFTMDGSPRELEIPIWKIMDGTPLVDNEIRGKVLAIAATETQIALLFAKGDVAIIDAESAKLLNTFKISADAFRRGGYFSTMTFTPDGQKLRITHGGKLFSLNLENGNTEALTLPTVEYTGPATYDENGIFWIMDGGPDQQIKGFDADGKLVGTAARKGGRPNRGKFLPDAVKNVSSVAADADGNLWAVECWELPRRISVWSPKDGTLVRDYLGNTGYAGCGGFLHEQDPTRGYAGPMEFILDPNSREWKLNAILWHPDSEKGESFHLGVGDIPHQCVFYSSASGTQREYMFVPLSGNYRPGYVIFLREGDDWRPTTMVGTVGAVSGRYAHHGNVEKPTSGVFAGYNIYDGMFWNDKNNDGKVQFDECQIFKTDHPADENRGGKPGLPMEGSWGVRMDTKTMQLYTVDRAKEVVYQYSPIGFTP